MSELLPAGYFRNRSIFENIQKESKSIILTEDQFQTMVRNMIMEALSIAEEVTTVANEISYHIKRQMRLNGEDKGVFRMFVFNKFFNIKWKIFDFTNKNSEKPKTLGALVNFDEGEIIINIPKNYDHIDLSFLKDSLQHEIEHIYQRFKRGDDTNFNENDKILYDQALNMLKSDNNEEKRLGRAMYLMFNGEQDAYVNGMYAAMKTEKDPELKNEIYYRSDAYRELKFLKEYLVEIYQHNNKELNDILQNINKDIFWLRKNINAAVKRFANKIGKGYANAIIY